MNSWQNWQKIVNSFKSEKEEYNGEAATLILMYLAINGDDYPYNIAKNFKKYLIKENGWNETRLHYLRSLKDANQLRTILKNMKKRDLLSSRKEPGGLHKTYYRLSINIMISPWPSYNFINFGEKKFDEEKDKAIATTFINKLGDRDICNYLKNWGSIGKFDFLTFLGLLNIIAKEMNDDEMINLITRNIEIIQNGEECSKKLHSILKISEEMHQKYKSRGDYGVPGPLDGMLDRFDNESE